MHTAEQAQGLSGTPHERRLAAVVFTDVVGYSSRMRADEAGTIRRVAADLARMRERCEARGGECLNSMGDGLMLSFASAVEAVSFAVDVQREFHARTSGPGEAEPLQHRIGVHMGDVIRLPDGTLAGDGVNIAARLEGNAPRGGVCISQAAYDTVKGKLPLDATYAGLQVFKNIGEPVGVWHLHPSGAPAGAAAAMPAKASHSLRRRKLVVGGAVAAAAVAGAGFFVSKKFLPGTQGAFDPHSIAVLPFSNMSDDKDAAYFADGIHEDLLTQLALVGQLKVVSRTSVMEYRNTSKKIPQIGRELNVAALVEGSVRRAGDTVRVTAQLVDSQADKHIWAANYDRSLRDVFKVQSELATEIARSLKVSLTDAEQKRLSAPSTTNEQAYDLYLRHQQLVREVAGTYRNVPSVNERVELLKKAVALDPQFAIAWAKLAAEHARARGWGQAEADESQAQAKAAIARAKQLAADDLQVGIEEAAVQLHGLDDQQAAIRTYRRVLARAPYNVEALYGLAEVLNELARDVEAVEALERGLSVDARHGLTVTRLAAVYNRYRHFDRALELRQRLIDMRPDSADLRAAHAYYVYWKTGSWDEYDAWRATVPRSLEKLSIRVRNIDTERAIARGDAAEVHRLVDVDSADWKKPNDRGTEVGFLALHALAWNAFGEPARARDAAQRAIPVLQEVVHKNPSDGSAWNNLAEMQAVLGQREPALASSDRAVAAHVDSGNLLLVELTRRRKVNVLALLGDAGDAVSMLRRHSAHPGFAIHEARVTLPLAPLWKRDDFAALVADPATNAPLPLDTPLRVS